MWFYFLEYFIEKYMELWTSVDLWWVAKDMIKNLWLRCQVILIFCEIDNLCHDRHATATMSQGYWCHMQVSIF